MKSIYCIKKSIHIKSMEEKKGENFVYFKCQSTAIMYYDLDIKIVMCKFLKC